MLLGHEAPGVVIEVGQPVSDSGGDDLATGDHVVCVFVPSCGHYEPCAEGRPALCEPGAAANGAGTLLSGRRRIHRADGTAVDHHLKVSAFAEYATVSRRSLVNVDPELPLEEVALFGCAVLTGVGAVVDTTRVSAGASVAVIGLGGAGLSSLLGAVAAGARRFVAMDLADDKLAFVLQLGATATFSAPDQTSPTTGRPATDGGVEYAFDLGGLREGVGVGLRDHAPWRHHRHGGAAAVNGHYGARAGAPNRRRADAQGQRHRNGCTEPRHSPVHRPLPARSLAGRPVYERPGALRGAQRGIRSAL